MLHLLFHSNLRVWENLFLYWTTQNLMILNSRKHCSWSPGAIGKLYQAMLKVEVNSKKRFRDPGVGWKPAAPEMLQALFEWFINVRGTLKARLPQRLIYFTLYLLLTFWNFSTLYYILPCTILLSFFIYCPPYTTILPCKLIQELPDGKLWSHPDQHPESKRMGRSVRSLCLCIWTWLTLFVEPKHIHKLSWYILCGLSWQHSYHIQYTCKPAISITW